MSELLQLITQLGLSIALVVFFVWQGWLREQRLAERIDKVEDAHRDTLTALVSECTVCIKDNTLALRELIALIHQQRRE